MLNNVKNAYENTDNSIIAMYFFIAFVVSMMAVLSYVHFNVLTFASIGVIMFGLHKYLTSKVGVDEDANFTVHDDKVISSEEIMSLMGSMLMVIVNVILLGAFAFTCLNVFNLTEITTVSVIIPLLSMFLTCQTLIASN